MAGETEKYPLIVRDALAAVARAAGAGQTFVKPDALTLAERTAEILDDCIDLPEPHKADLMAAGVLCYLPPGQDDLETAYNIRVAAIVTDIRHGIDPRMFGGASKDVLRVCTAARVAEYEHLLVILRRGHYGPEALMKMRGRLTSAKRALDRSAFSDIGAGRLQAFEDVIYRRVLTEIENKISRATGGGGVGFLPLRPVFRRQQSPVAIKATTSATARAAMQSSR
jgi:hypothetical protein